MSRRGRREWRSSASRRHTRDHAVSSDDRGHREDRGRDPRPGRRGRSALGPSRKPPVVMTINGHSYRGSVAFMGGEFWVGVTNDFRRTAGVAAGDDVDVDLVLDTQPREVVVPPDLAAALDADPEARVVLRRPVLQQQATDRRTHRRRKGTRDASAPDREVGGGAPRPPDLRRLMPAISVSAGSVRWMSRWDRPCQPRYPRRRPRARPDTAR